MTQPQRRPRPNRENPNSSRRQQRPGEPSSRSQQGAGHARTQQGANRSRTQQGANRSRTQQSASRSRSQQGSGRSRTQQGANRSRTQPSRRPPRRRSLIPLFAALALIIAIIVIAVFALPRCSGDATVQDNGTTSQTNGTQEPTGSTQGTVSFVAVGDNIPELVLGEYADACAGEPGDGLYDFKPLYANVKSTIAAADLSYVDQEVHLGGDDIGPQDYPAFNVPDAMADALVDTGFDLCATASNHSLDWGIEALVNSRNTLGNTSMVVAGTAVDDQQFAQIATVERNGITFAFLNYDYAVNGLSWSEVPANRIKSFDDDLITQEVTAAKQMADMVIVAAHWGTEYQYEPNSLQSHYAQLFADLGVDIVVGSHPHVIGPLQWLTGQNGNKTLVAYSLGNFVSHHDDPILDNQLEGMLSCDFVRQDDGSVSIENIVWTPLVMHDQDGAYAVYALKDYTAELASRHRGLASLDDPIGQMKQVTAQTIGSGFTIDD